MTYSDHDHSHCWAQKQPPACGIEGTHNRCCICTKRNPNVPTPDIKVLANTMIRGSKAISFPLGIGYVTDLRDTEGNHFLDIRGWGRLQYHPAGDAAAEKLQDDIATWVADTLNAAAKEAGL